MSTPRAPRAVPGASRSETAKPPVKFEFLEDRDVYTGTGEGGRQWRVRRVLTGWKLEFIDSGDTTHTNAGIHVSLAAAQAEATR